MCTSWFWKLADSVSVDLNLPLVTLPSSDGVDDFISFLDKDFHPNVVQCSWPPKTKVVRRSAHSCLFHLSVPWLAAHWYAKAFCVEKESWSTGLKNSYSTGQKRWRWWFNWSKKIRHDSLYCIALHCYVSYGILWYLIGSNSIARYCMLLWCWLWHTGCAFILHDIYYLHYASEGTSKIQQYT